MKNNYFITMVVFFILPLSGLGIDVFVPSLPAISDYFHVDKGLAQLSVTAYILGLGIMQFFAGSISDSFGRRKPYLVAMTIFIIATLLVPLSFDIHQLLILRFIQGCAIALAIVPLRSVVMDLFNGRELRKMLNYMTIVWSIGPIVAPLIGGYLQHYFGWQYCFYFLLGYATFFFIISLKALPETSKHRHPFHMNSIIERDRRILFNKTFMLSVITASLLYSLVLVFSIIGPFLIQKVLHFTPVAYGKIALLMGGVWFLGATINRFLIDIPIKTKAKYCLGLMLVLCFVLLFIQWHYPISILNIVVPISCIIGLSAIIFPNYFQKCIALFPTTTGSANAIYGSFIYLISGAVSGVASLLKSNSAVPMACAMIVITFICIVLTWLDKSN